MWDKFVSQVKAYPWLFGGVAIAIIIWVFWPSGAKASGGNGAEMQAMAIAQSAAANAQLMLAHEETQRVGLQVAAAQAINAQNTAAAVQGAQIQANVAQFAADKQLEAYKVEAGAQKDLTSFILESQNSAQKWVADMEAASGIIPGNFQTYGFINAAPSIVKVEPAPPPPIYLPQNYGMGNGRNSGLLDSFAGSDAYGQTI